MKIDKLKCTYANRYKAIRKPTCGCKVCFDKWNEANSKKLAVEQED